MVILLKRLPLTALIQKMSKLPIDGLEHMPIRSADIQKHRKWLTDNTLFKKPETLGLDRSGDNFVPGNYIGMVWLGEGKDRDVLRVDSKFSTMDYIAMYVECLAHPKIGSRAVNCLKFWTEENLIDITEHDEFSILTIIAYLYELNEFCRQHMRRHFVREQQNFVGKMKGKILIDENTRRNIIHARPDRIYCEYQSVSDDILENQILRTALERAAHYFAEYRGNKDTFDILHQWIRTSRAALQGVSTRKVKLSDFASTRKRGAFVFYASPLALAKAVLQRLGPTRKQKKSQAQTPPFALNSAQLFERYAAIKLLEDSENFSDLLLGSKIGSPDYGDFNVKVRPDFYIPGEQATHIIDAKYKYIDFEGMEIDDNDGKHKLPQNDLYQVIAYSQHEGLLRKIKRHDDNSIKLGLAYPDENTESVISKKQTRAFTLPLTVYGIPYPKNNKNN